MKKNLKKVLAAGLAATMVMGISVPAFAAVEGKDETGKDITITESMDEDKVTITKFYNLYDDEDTDKAVSPAEKFLFTIEAASVTDAAEGINKTNMPIPTFGTVENGKGVISFEAGAAGSSKNSEELEILFYTTEDGVKKSIFSSVGIYKYTIKEVSGDTAGVTYYAPKTIELTVTVVQDEKGLIRVAAVHTAEEDPNETKGESTSTYKLGQFSNTYSAGALSISKTVTGNMGDREKDFTVNITFTTENSKEIKENITSDFIIGYKEDETTGEKTNEPIYLMFTPEDMESGSCTKQITLKHDHTITFDNIPLNTEYTVWENDYTKNEDNTPNYEKPEYVGENVITVGEIKKVTGTIEYVTSTTGEGDEVVTTIKGVEHDTIGITNKKGEVVDTGISLDALPYLMMLGMSGLGALGFAGKRRKEEDEI